MSNLRANTSLVTTTLTLLTLLAVPGKILAQEQSAQSPANTAVKVSVQRRTTIIEVMTPCDLPDSTLITVQLQAGTQILQSTTLSVEDKKVAGKIQTRKLLIHGEYVCLLSLADKQPDYLSLDKNAVWKTELKFRHGDEDSEKIARANLESWLKTAHQTLLRFTKNLENQGLWHSELLKISNAAEQKKQIIEHFQRQFGPQSNFFTALKIASQDLQLYRRRLLFDPYKQTSQALMDWLAGLRARSTAIHQHLQTQPKKPLPPASAIKLLAEKAKNQLSGAAKAEKIDWTASPLAKIESGETKNGQYLSQTLGFSIAVPENWVAKPFRQLNFNYSSRLRLTIDPKAKSNVSISVSLQELTPGQKLIDKVATEAWENRQSYKKIDLKAENDVVSHSYTAEIPLAKSALKVRVQELHIPLSQDICLVIAATAPAKDFEDYAKTFDTVLNSIKLPKKD